MKLKVLPSEDLDSILKKGSVSEAYDGRNFWYAHKIQRRIMGDKYYLSAKVSNSYVSLVAEVSPATYHLLGSFLNTDVPIDESCGAISIMRCHVKLKYRIDYPEVPDTALSDVKRFLDVVERLNMEYNAPKIIKRHY